MAKVQWGIDEIPVDSRQLAKVTGVYWRKSPEYIGESPVDSRQLAKVQWTFAIGECSVGENLIGEIRESRTVTWTGR